MKISKIKIGILVIFIIILLVQTVVYASSVLNRRNEYTTKKLQIETEDVELKQEEKLALDLINKYRNENGLEDLKPITELQSVAQIKAEDLVNNNYFSHTSPILGTPFEMLNDNGVMYKTAGENLAGNINAERAVDAWINSPTHRDNILDDEFEYTGIYVIDSDIYGKVFVQLFIGLD